jgi:hypothetical protein
VALEIGRIATPETVQAWIERAERRTVKHLDEEMRAAEMLARNGAITEIRPPTDGELAAVFAVEQTLLEGELLPKPPKGRARSFPVPVPRVHEAKRGAASHASTGQGRQRHEGERRVGLLCVSYPGDSPTVLAERRAHPQGASVDHRP